MDIHQDLLKNKYFLLILGVIAIFALVVYFIDYNSLESRCKRKYGLASRIFSPRNRLQELQLEKAAKMLVEECVKNGGI